MKPISLYLDEAIDSGRAKNDSETAKKIGVTRASISDWRNRRTNPNDEQAVKLAEFLGKDPGELLAECGAARAKTPATRQAWERVAARMASYSITICAFIIPLGQSEKASACQDGQECQMLLFSELLKRILIKNLVRHLRVMTECINVITHEVCS